jgi:ATP-dependent metalloprotease
MARRQRDVIDRFENSTCAHDEEGYRQYIAALVETGQEGKVMPEILKHMEGKLKKKEWL